MPNLHPAVTLGVSPRNGGEMYHAGQVLVFLEQLRDAVSNTLRLSKFKLNERKPKDAIDKMAVFNQ